MLTQGSASASGRARVKTGRSETFGRMVPKGGLAGRRLAGWRAYARFSAIRLSLLMVGAHWRVSPRGTVWPAFVSAVRPNYGRWAPIRPLACHRTSAAATSGQYSRGRPPQAGHRSRAAGLWPSPRASDAPPPPVQAPGRAAARAPSGRPGVEPESVSTCPPSHPIKGNFTTYSGERCIYHVPGGRFYGRTKPERCYATGDEARQDGCRASRR